MGAGDGSCGMGAARFGRRDGLRRTPVALGGMVAVLRGAATRRLVLARWQEMDARAGDRALDS